jgi:purine nucleosidase
MPAMKIAFLLLALAVSSAVAQKRLVLIDQDGSGPGGSNQMAMLALLQAPSVEVLGITIVTGNAWRDEEVQHTLRMLELTGHTSVPVAAGAVFPLVRSQQETQLAAALNGNVTWLGAWGQGPTMLVESPTGIVPAAADHRKPHGPMRSRPCRRAGPG